MRPPVSWSIEISTTGLLKANSLAARVSPRLPAGVRIYLPALPQDPPDAIENALTLLRRENPGLVPVPHIAASREPSVASLEARLAAWQRQRRRARRSSTAATASARTTRGLRRRRRRRRRARSPRASSCWRRARWRAAASRPSRSAATPRASRRRAVGRRARRAQVEARVGRREQRARARRAQFCFYTGQATSYVDALHADGVGADVSLGVVGPSSLALRQRMAERCGVAAPTRRTRRRTCGGSPAGRRGSRPRSIRASTSTPSGASRRPSSGSATLQTTPSLASGSARSSRRRPTRRA